MTEATFRLFAIALGGPFIVWLFNALCKLQDKDQ